MFLPESKKKNPTFNLVLSLRVAIAMVGGAQFAPGS